MKDIEKMERKNPFSVPDGYFEKVTEDLLQSAKSVTPPDRERKLLTIIRPHLTLAAAMIALVVVTYTGLRLLLPGMHTGGIDKDSIAEYITQEVDQEVIIEQIVELEQVTTQSDLPHNEIVEYLVENGIDISAIIENY